MNNLFDKIASKNLKIDKKGGLIKITITLHPKQPRERAVLLSPKRVRRFLASEGVVAGALIEGTSLVNDNSMDLSATWVFSTPEATIAAKEPSKESTKPRRSRKTTTNLKKTPAPAPSTDEQESEA